MRPSTLVLATGLLAWALLPPESPAGANLVQPVQYSTGAPDQTIHGRKLEDAPVPPPAPSVAPVDRAAGAGSRDLTAGPVDSTPFSAGPASAAQSGSPATPNALPGSDATPNLGH